MLYLVVSNLAQIKVTPKFVTAEEQEIILKTKLERTHNLCDDETLPVYIIHM